MASSSFDKLRINSARRISADNVTKKISVLFPTSICRRLPKDIAVIEISLPESEKLNLIYRGKRRPTNVLSFRYDSAYGEILICPDVIRKEAKKQGNSYRFQMTWMIVHGILHLAGVHHERSLQQARRVEKIEEQILGQLFHS